MRNIVHKLLIVCLFSSCSPKSLSMNGTCKKCDIGILREVQMNIGKLEKGIVEAFFCTIDSSCKNDTEFSEFSSEILFKVLYEMTEFSVSTISNLKPNKKIIILNKLASPPESLNLNELISKVSMVRKNSTTRIEIIQSLELAMDKYKQ